MTEGSNIELSVVMPCLNEAETLGACINEARRFLDNSCVTGEIIVGDNGSTDGSQEIALQHGARVVAVSVRGYGAALDGAIQTAKGKYVVIGDSDFSYNFSELMPFLERLRSGDDLVMGNRFAGCIAAGAMPWKNRYIGNPVLSGIGRLFFNCNIKDLHCGLRAFHKDAYSRLRLQTVGMEFASEMVIKATILKMQISEVPVKLRPDGRSHPPHLRPWRDGWRHLRFMLLFSPLWLFLYPGLSLMLIGIFTMLRIAHGPLFIGAIGFDIHTMLYAGMSILLGFQCVMFAFLSKTFAINEGLHNKEKWFKKISRFLTLEVGIAFGLLFILVGVSISFIALSEWKQASFGNIDPRHIFRLVIPGSICVTLGAETIFASFFMSVLGLRLKTKVFNDHA